MARVPTSNSRQGRFELLRRLGVGGMGEVWIARAPGEPLVAIKRMLPHLLHDKRAAQMFLDEARIASQLDHPNVVRILEVDHDEDVQWFAMELVLGENLGKLGERARKKTMPVDPAVAARVIGDAAAGVDHAHTRTDARGRPLGIIHRDVTPPNVMVTDDGQVKVLDFGIAKAFDRVARTEAGAFKGKVEYLSPEQILGAELDHRIDIFALGAVLFELLTGKKLFARSSMVATLGAITECRVPRPSKVAPSVPRALDDIVLRALARDREQRYATAAELSDALEAFAQESRLPRDALAQWVGALCPDEQVERRRLMAPAVRRAESLVEGPALVEVLERAFAAGPPDEDAPFVDFARGSEAPTQLARVRPEVSEAIDPILAMAVDLRPPSSEDRLAAELERTEDPARTDPALRPSQPPRAIRSRPPPPPPVTTAAVAAPPPAASPTSSGARDFEETVAAGVSTAALTEALASVAEPDGAADTRLAALAGRASSPPGRAGPGRLSPPAPPALPGEEDAPHAGRWGLVVGFAALTVAGALVGGTLVYDATPPAPLPPSATRTLDDVRVPQDPEERLAAEVPAAAQAPAAVQPATAAAAPSPPPPAPRETTAAPSPEASTRPVAPPPGPEAAGGTDDAAPATPAATPSPTARAAASVAPRVRTSTRARPRPRPRSTTPVGPDDVEIEIE